MLDAQQRADRYHTQNGGIRLTPKQARRINHKFNHQSQEAAARREGVAIVRASLREARKRRISGLLAR